MVVKATTAGFDILLDPPADAYTDSIIEYNVLHWGKSEDCTSYREGGHLPELQNTLITSEMVWDRTIRITSALEMAALDAKELHV